MLLPLCHLGKLPFAVNKSFWLKVKPLQTLPCAPAPCQSRSIQAISYLSHAWYRNGLFIAWNSLNAKHDIGYQLPLALVWKLFITLKLAWKPTFLTRTTHNIPVPEKNVTSFRSEGNPTFSLTQSKPTQNQERTEVQPFSLQTWHLPLCRFLESGCV